MLHVVNDNKLGSHVVRVSVPAKPLVISYPPHQVRVFKDRNDYVPNFHKITTAYNEKEKPNPSNQYSNNYQKTAYKTSTQESGIQNWFRI